METKTDTKWITVAERNPRITGNFPVVVNGSPDQWEIGFFDSSVNEWGKATLDPSLIMPDPLEVEMWYPLPRP